jgi:DNA-binding response OmpR family regulator
MDDEFVILIADRNRRVREFLERELSAEGYRVLVARDGREVLATLEGDEPPDLLILDLEIHYIGGLTILERLHGRTPAMPVVIHTFLTELSSNLNVPANTTFVEKSGNVDLLKAAVRDMLKRFYSHRFSTIQAGDRAGEE